LLILAINPGSTSTKVAVFDDARAVFTDVVRHPEAELARFPRVAEQYEFRLQAVVRALGGAGVNGRQLAAVVGRGGLMRPVAAGTYHVNERMVADLEAGVQGEHPSNLGGIMAHNLGRRFGCPAFVVDPVAVDELDDVARLSGLPGVPRRSLAHALNIRAVAREVAAGLGKGLDESRLIVAHLGTGISVAALAKGRMVDVNNPIEEGPFSVERSGGLPATSLVDLCFSGRYTAAELKRRLMRSSGLVAYLGTRDFAAAEARAREGDARADLVVRAMAYQIAKEIGAMAAVLGGRVDAVALTGGMAHSEWLCGLIRRRVEFIAPAVVVPGEEELRALALGALRALRGEEEAKDYGDD